MLNKQKLLLLFLCIGAWVSAQQSITIADEVSQFRLGKEFYDNEQYVAASECFQKYIDANASIYTERAVEARYYIVYSSYLQGKGGVDIQMKSFIEDNEGSFWANDMRYALVRYYFSKEKFKYVIKIANDCDETLLTSEQLEYYHYEVGYSDYKLDNLVSAKPEFKSAMELGGQYTNAALYYYSFLQYKDENYMVALEGFEKLYEVDEYKESAPYYMAQIYFMKGKYHKLVDLAPALLELAEGKNAEELNRIIGDAYYYMKEYDNAIKYLEAYQQMTKTILRQDLYHLGMAYYLTKDYAKAAETLAQVKAQNDPISQSSYTFLGECFVRLDDKEKACLAFGTASKYEFDPIQQEDAFYNYVKLSYETSISPFSGSISLFEKFLAEFSDSEYRSEIYNMMYKSYMSTTNYAVACQSIQNIQNKDGQMTLASQRVHYYRGVELYKSGNYKHAVNYFQKALEGAPLEKILKAKSYYWLGDSYYQMKQYDEALSGYNKFITSAGAYSIEEFGVAHYNLGYCFFKANNYNAAINWFRKYLQLNKTTDIDFITDANNRVGDCYYLKKDYLRAVTYYSHAIEYKGKGFDYAYFQKGFSQGLNNSYEPKIVSLSTLLADYPESPYADDAMYEIARSWITLNRYDQAIAVFKELPVAYPNSKYASKAILNAGLAYYNNAELSEAITSYKQVVSEYGGTEDSKAALAALKNISIDQNTVNEYIAYAKEAGVADMESSEEDSLTFLAAEKLYMVQNYDDALVALTNYTKNFKNGSYVLISYFYMADAFMQQDMHADAMTCLEYIVKQPRSIYTEQSLAVLSSTYFSQDLFAKALDSYKKLLINAELKENILAAKIGIVDCNYALSEAGATILAVDNLLVESLPALVANKAYFYKAQSYLALDNKNAAKESFAILAQDLSHEYGAESKYIIAEMAYAENDLITAKNETLDFINKGTPQQYWLAKTFILLSDIYVAEKDYFQAKQYLLSINDNYVLEDDILGIVQVKLAHITQIEENQNKTKRDSISEKFSTPNASIQ